MVTIFPHHFSLSERPPLNQIEISSLERMVSINPVCFSLIVHIIPVSALGSPRISAVSSESHVLEKLLLFLHRRCPNRSFLFASVWKWRLWSMLPRFYSKLYPLPSWTGWSEAVVTGDSDLCVCSLWALLRMLIPRTHTDQLTGSISTRFTSWFL